MHQKEEVNHNFFYLVRFLFLFFVFFFPIYMLGQDAILNREISFKAQEKSIKEVLKSLEEMVQFTFGYSDTNIDAKRIVSLQVDKKPLKQVLRIIFPSFKYRFKVTGQKLLIYREVDTVAGKQESKQFQTLNGYIKELGSLEHLPAVSLYIPELNKGTISNDYGFYSLTVSKGVYEVVLSYVGFKEIRKKIDFTNDINLDFYLEAEAFDLDEVVIEVSGEAKESNVTQMSMTQVKISEIEDIPTILGEKDVIKNLQLLPGIQSGGEGGTGLYVRGGTPDQNLIILDNATVYNSNHLLGFFSVFQGNAIQSVETFKAGFPARFGGRLSSVVKVNMKNGNKEKLTGKIEMGLISSSLFLEGPIKKEKTSFVLSGRRSYADLLTLPFQNSDNRFVAYFTDVIFKMHHVFSEKDKLFWSNYFGQDKFSIKDEFNDTKNKSKVSWGNITSTLRWNHEFSNKLFSNMSFIFSNYNFQVNIDTKEKDGNSFFKTNSGINDFGVKADFEYYPNPDHTIRLGVQSTFHDFVPKQLAIIGSKSENTIENIENIESIQRLKSFESGVYIEDDWKVSDRLSINSGVRLSYFNSRSLHYVKPEPRLGIAYKMNANFTAKASYAKMNQYIHLLSNSGIGLPTDLWVSSTDRVKPQISEQIALGLVKDFSNTGLSLTLESYYKKMNNVISYKEGASFYDFNNLVSTNNVDWENNITSGKGWAYGTEFLLRKRRGKFTGWLGYSLSWSQRQFKDINRGKKFNAKYDRRHDMSVVGIYKPSKKITLSGTWVFSSGINYTLPSLAGISNNDLFILGGSEGVLFGQQIVPERNNFRGESSHRLDIGIQFHKTTRRKNIRTWGVSLYNAYGQNNPFFYTIGREISNKNGTVQQKQSVKRISILKFIPSINYSLKF